MTRNPIGSESKHFQYLGKIGSGGFATVYKAKCLEPGVHGLEVAIKEISKEEVRRKKLQYRVEQEILIHSQLQHPSILKLHTTFEDKEKVYLILEFCEKGSLDEYLKLNGPMCEEDAHYIITQIIEGLQYLHSKFILHRDLSLKNILLTKHTRIKIADFGMAAKLSQPDEKKHTMLGTANFMSPEVVTRNSHGFEADCWGLGCILYALLVGKPPFDNGGVVQTLKDVIMSDFSIPESISMEAKDLICDLLQKNPKDRVDLNGAMKYSFFTKHKTKSKCYSEKSSDSGMGSLSLSAAMSMKSNCRSMGTLDTDVTSYSHHRLSHKTQSCTKNLNTIHSSGCSYHSSESLSHCSYKCEEGVVSRNPVPASPPSKLKRRKEQKRSVRHLKNRIPTLPSRNELYDYSPAVLTGSVNSRERSASEERRKQECHKVYSQDSEAFPRQLEVPFERNALAYNRFDDIQIRSCLKSPLPYPSHRLENIIDDHLCKSYLSSHERYGSGRYSSPLCRNNEDSAQTSCHECLSQPLCSHDRYCSSENVHCSHEVVCSCRKLQVPAQDFKNNSLHSQNDCNAHQLLPEEKSLRNKVPPISTVRLMPKRHSTKNAIVSILSNGQVCIEFLKTRKNKKCVVDVCVISPDGMMIFLYKPKGLYPVCDEPPPIPQNPQEVRYFNYESLPEVHWKKYQYAARFIDIIKAKTPKITVYGKKAKCIMMENAPDPDYESVFFDGGKVTVISGKISIIDKDGKTGNLEHLNEDFLAMWNEFLNIKDRCQRLEKSLDSLQKEDAKESYFPAVIGRRPSVPLGEIKENKENVTPTSLKSSSALNRAVENMKSFAGSIDNSSPSENSKKYTKEILAPTPKEHGKKPTIYKRSIDEILPNLKSLPKVVNGKIFTEYKDGIQMWSSQQGSDVFFYDACSGQKFKINQNPEFLKRVCYDLQGILLHVAYEQRKIMR